MTFHHLFWGYLFPAWAICAGLVMLRNLAVHGSFFGGEK